MQRPDEQWDTTRAEPLPKPPFRRLSGYAFDPSLSTQMDTALVNQVVFTVPWEGSSELGPGPVGEYIEVIDYDPASRCFYAPLDLNSPTVLAQDGIPPSEGNPQFHQQMVYAVAMTTIRNFERALGRLALWAPSMASVDANVERVSSDTFVRRLRIYPHALREANAYYSPAKKALLFGYFPAAPSQKAEHYPGGMVFTCLSHDIIAHETTHALLDGMHRRFIEPNNQDTLAFHEAFADIVALFQHFSFPTVLRHQIAKTRGDLAAQNALGQLAQQFGRAIGQHGALRDAIGHADPTTGEWRRATPNPEALASTCEPHARGAILVAAVFEAFLAIYQCRVADLFRIASSGTGILPAGSLHPDLIQRLADEAAKAAQHVLNMCIRALDYCPPVDITFGDYLRALITADSDLVPNDDLNYRVAFMEAFRRRGIFPDNVRTFSVDSLRWPRAMRGRDSDTSIQQQILEFAERISKHLSSMRAFSRDRHDYFERSQKLAATLHNAIHFDSDLRSRLDMLSAGALSLEHPLDGMDTRDGPNETRKMPVFEVHGVRAAQRVGPDGDALNHAVLILTQKRRIAVSGLAEKLKFRGGCTLIFNLDTFELQYAIGKSLTDQARLDQQIAYRTGGAALAFGGTYRGGQYGTAMQEPFALLHRDPEERGA